MYCILCSKLYWITELYGVLYSVLHALLNTEMHSVMYSVLHALLNTEQHGVLYSVRHALLNTKLHGELYYVLHVPLNTELHSLLYSVQHALLNYWTIWCTVFWTACSTESLNYIVYCILYCILYWILNYMVYCILYCMLYWILNYMVYCPEQVQMAQMQASEAPSHRPEASLARISFSRICEGQSIICLCQLVKRC